MGKISDWLIGGQDLLQKQYEKTIGVSKKSGVTKAIEQARYEGMLEMFRELTNWDAAPAGPYQYYHELIELKKSS